MANSWQINCNGVRPSTRVRRRHCSGVICTCAFRSRRAERSRGSNTISGRMNEVSIRIGGRGTATGWGGERGRETGGSELLNLFKTGLGDSGRVEDSVLDGFSPTEISFNVLNWAAGGGNDAGV